MPDLSFGLYPKGETAGTEVSSTSEGRHVSLYASEITSPTGTVVKGDPVVFGTIAGNHGVGVAFKSEKDSGDIIAIDTEGIWNLSVVGSDDDGGSLITGGDRLYINVNTCVISKISNPVTQIPFGYALGQATGDESALVIAVKVHFGASMTGGTDLKSFDHVRGTVAAPIVWGTDTSDVESMVMTVGVMTDYISGLFMRAYAEAATPAGGIQGLIYSRITAQDDIQDMYAIRGRVDLVMDTPGAHIANMAVGGMFSVSLDNAGFALTLADRIKALDVAISQSATSTITTGSICGIYVAMNGIETDNGGRTAGIYIYQGGGGTSYPDYGIHIVTESENVLAAILINSLNVDTPVGIDFETSGGFGYVSLLRYDGPVTPAGAEYFLTFTEAAGLETNTMILEVESNNDQDADYAIRVRLTADGVDRVIRLYEA